jgi:hypothetical protein
MEPTNEILDDYNTPLPSGLLTPQRHNNPRRSVIAESYKRLEYNGSPIPNIIPDEKQHCPGRIEFYKFNIIHPGNKLTKKQINITDPIGHLITRTWSNIRNEYMINLNNLSHITIEITSDEESGVIYETPELLLKIKKGEDIHLVFETIDEARDCQLYLLSILSNI